MYLAKKILIRRLNIISGKLIKIKMKKVITVIN
ncbi:MAG: hypothetical protein ACJA2M_001702 [Polaribacter sp.]|jgi:hypothetical protein